MATGDDTDRYWMRSTGSGKGSDKRAAPTTTSRGAAALDRSIWVTKCANRVLSSYRKDDFADPEGYGVQLAMVLERHDDKVIEMVTSPAVGIQRTSKFPPSIAEMVEFIEEHIRRAGFAADYDAKSRKQLEERGEYERQGKTESPEHRREVAERIKRELAEAFKEGRGAPFNVFVPTFAPQYRDMLARGGRPGVSLEDKTRTGVWVPLAWLQGLRAPAKWTPFTPEQLQTIYGREAPMAPNHER